MPRKRSASSRRARGRESPPDDGLQEEGEDVTRTPTSKRVRLNLARGGTETEVRENDTSVVVAAIPAGGGNIVTPAVGATARGRVDSDPLGTHVARRSLFLATPPPVPITPSRDVSSPAKRRLMFGRMVTEIHIQENVRRVYKIVRKLTGTLGGNASSGPIYGELTMGSMQKMINLMKEHTGFSAESRFIDVGSGIGKPNLHVVQDPGVCFSYGIEVETARWLLGMTCLKGMLEAAVVDTQSTLLIEAERIKHKCMFEEGDIRQARIFDPFTHVYMFSIGFPPTLWYNLADIWNRSSSPYMICYHGPRDIIENYEFDVDLIAQTQTSMHGSREGHMGYIYKRKSKRPFDSTACDPLFATAYAKVGQVITQLKEDIDKEVERCTPTGPSTRSRRSSP